MTRNGSKLKLMLFCACWLCKLATNIAFICMSFRFTTLSTPSMPVVPMNWASQPISSCGYWSFRTWTATVTGGWGRQKAGEAMCLPTTSANQNTHEQVFLCGWYLRLYFDLKKANSASRQNKKTNKHLDTLWLFFFFWICCHGVWKWGLTIAADSPPKS